MFNEKLNNLKFNDILTENVLIHDVEVNDVIIFDDIFSFPFVSTMKIELLKLFYDDDRKKMYGKNKIKNFSKKIKKNSDCGKFLYSSDFVKYISKIFPEIKLSSNIDLYFNFYQRFVGDIYNYDLIEKDSIGIIYFPYNSYNYNPLLDITVSPHCITDIEHPMGNQKFGEANFPEYVDNVNNTFLSHKDGGFILLNGRKLLARQNRLILYKIKSDTTCQLVENLKSTSNFLYGFIYKEGEI